MNAHRKLFAKGTLSGRRRGEALEVMTAVAPERVLAQLDKVLASPDFAAGERLRQFLRFVVEHSLNGRSAQIKQRTLAKEALGYGDDFEPGSNPTVRIVAHRVRRALERYYARDGVSDPIRIEIPKGGYVPLITANPTAVAAPATSAGPSRQSPLERSADSRPTIAVITFDCLNARDQVGYVATGLTEEILIALTRFAGFVVVGPLSASIIHDQRLDARGVGEKHGVRFVLSGSLRTFDEKLRLTVRLSDALSGRQIWGEALDCDRRNGSVLECEQRVVSRVVASIADAHGVVPRLLATQALQRSTTDPAAYDAFLRFFHHMKVQSEQSHADAEEALQQVVQRDPDNATAMGMLSDLWASTYLWGFTDDPALDRAEALARKAMAVDSTCQHVRYAMALLHFLRFQRTAFVAEAERVVDLNPNHALNLAALGAHLAMVGEWQRGLELTDRAVRLNPHIPSWHHIVRFMVHYSRGEYEVARTFAQRFNTPGFFWDPLIRAAVLGQLDRRAEAASAVEELLTSVPDFATRGPNLVKRLAFLDEHVEMLLDGLRKAGLTTQT